MAVWQVSGPKIHFFLIFLLYGEKHYSCRRAPGIAVCFITALLKRKDLYPEHVLGATAAIAHQIENTQSRYKPQAEGLIRALGL
jgi:hypothetical protein